MASLQSVVPGFRLKTCRNDDETPRKSVAPAILGPEPTPFRRSGDLRAGTHTNPSLRRSSGRNPCFHGLVTPSGTRPFRRNGRLGANELSCGLGVALAWSDQHTFNIIGCLAWSDRHKPICAHFPAAVYTTRNLCDMLRRARRGGKARRQTARGATKRKP